VLLGNNDYIEELQECIQKVTNELGNQQVITILSEYSDDLVKKAKKQTKKDIQD